MHWQSSFKLYDTRANREHAPARGTSGETIEPHSWHEASVTRMTKIERAVMVADFRPITILQVLQKLALKMWMVEAGPYLALRRRSSHGFRTHFQAAELHQSEWNLPTFIAKLDINKTYDTVAWSALDWLFERRHLPLHLQCANWRMHYNRVLHSHTADGTVHVPVAPTGGMPQGAPESPLIYAALVEELLDVVDAHLAVQVEYARVHRPYRAGNAVFYNFADGTYVFGMSPLQLSYTSSVFAALNKCCTQPSQKFELTLLCKLNRVWSSGTPINAWSRFTVLGRRDRQKKGRHR